GARGARRPPSAARRSRPTSPEVVAALVGLAERQALPLGPDGGPGVRWACPAALAQSTSLRCPTMPGAEPEMAHVLAIEMALTPCPPSSYGQQKGEGADRLEMVAAQEGARLCERSVRVVRACQAQTNLEGDDDDGQDRGA